MEVASLYYDLNIDDKSLKRQLDDADKSVKSFGDRIGEYWGASEAASKRLLLGVAAVGAGVVAFGVSSVKAFEDSQNKIAQTNAVLKSTGEIAGVTADAVTKLATSLEAQTKFSDEDVRSVENLLLTFTAIGKNIFPQATKTVLDMATALGEDTKSASIQLGKALQDPILGVTALRRVGVNFNAAQQEVIANLVNTGKSAQAQQLILKELNKEFGGSAEAAGNTLAGALEKLKNQLNNVQEAIGGLIAKAVTPLLNSLMDWFNSVGGVDGVMQLLKDGLERIKPDLPFIAGAIVGMLVPAIVALTISFGQFLLVLAPWAALGVGLVLLFQHFGISIDDVTNAATRLYTWLSGYLTPALANIKQVWDGLYPSIAAVGAAIWQNLLPAMVQLWDAVTRLWAALNPALLDAIKFIAIALGVELYAYVWLVINATRVAIDTFSWLASVISNLIKWVSNLISWYGAAYGAIIGFFASLPSAIGKAIAGVTNVIIAPFKAAFDWINGQINQLINAINSIKNAPGKAVSGVSGLLGKIPGFADGGIVPGALGAPTLAVVHGGETVIPNGQSAGTTFNIGQINNTQDENYVIRRLDRNTQLEGMGISPM